MPIETKPLTALDLHAWLTKEGAPQDRIETLKNMPPGSLASNGIAALGGAGLSHRFLERAQAFVDGNGVAAPEPAKAWDKDALPKAKPAGTSPSISPRSSDR